MPSKKTSKKTNTRKTVAIEVLDPRPAQSNSESIEDVEWEEKSSDEDIVPLEAESDAEAMLPSVEVLEPLADKLPVSDPLKNYLNEIRKTPLLEPEEEIKLAKRLIDDGDLNAAKMLVQANLRLVVKIAMEYRAAHGNLMDLIQEGNIGLMKAVSKFDPARGVRLGYYASWWIRSYILKYILDNFRLVKVGTTAAQKKLFYHLMREKERLEAQGLVAAPKLLAQRLDVSEKDVVEMEQRLLQKGAESSLDAPMKSDDTGKKTRGEMFADDRESPDDALEREELLQILRTKLPGFQKGLDDREKKILKERLLSEVPKTLQEIADKYGLTRERARQIETKVITKLKDYLKDEL